MPRIVNCHVLDQRNVGDLLSSPLRYFDFPGYDCQTEDIRNLDINSLKNCHILIGGGGLLFERFAQPIKDIAIAETGKKILWGAGQQSYRIKVNDANNFNYKPYVHDLDLVGIRDDGMDYSWIPCVSCMHPEFDNARMIKHKFVVFSHKKFQIDFPDLPRMTNENVDFPTVLDFLGSGETILTSSFHGAYWGLMLGRRVLAFPFSSKFFTMRHKPALYPVKKWSRVQWRLSVLGKTLYTAHHKGEKLACDISGWQAYLEKTQPYPSALEECRSRNRWFYEQVLGILKE